MVNGSLYVFGGEDTSRRPVSELHVLDLATMAWRPVMATGCAPAARSAHTALAYKVRSAGWRGACGLPGSHFQHVGAEILKSWLRADRISALV